MIKNHFRRKAMLLADKIIALRKQRGWSQEELAEQLGVSRQSISKWESMQMVPSLDKIVKLAEIFAVSTDFLLREEIEDPNLVKPVPAETVQQGEPAHVVSLEEANAFLSLSQHCARRQAWGVGLLIAVFIFVSLNSISPVFNFGIVVCVSWAVGLFVFARLNLKNYDHLRREPIELAYGVAGMVRERRQALLPARNVKLTTGIVICAAVFLVLGISGNLNGWPTIPLLQFDLILLILIGCLALGAGLITEVAVSQAAFKILLEENRHNPAAKALRRRMLFFRREYALASALILAADWWIFRGHFWLTIVLIAAVLAYRPAMVLYSRYLRGQVENSDAR